MNFKRSRRCQQASLNLIRQLEKIHDLGYARPGNPLSGGYFRLSQPGIVIQFSPPRLRQHKRMDARFRYFGFVLIGRGEAFKNVGRERDWMENKRLVTPTGKGYSNGQTELPESSGFTRASGATSIWSKSELFQRIRIWFTLSNFRKLAIFKYPKKFESYPGVDWDPNFLVHMAKRSIRTHARR